ncbi:MAG TPA: hypothetical protein G4O12_03940 [Dehalococcoidia bacterium]|nr:hypothetical protein [Dehalococcoidia bacterium]
MGTKAYFMIDVVDAACQGDKWLDAQRDLEAIPEVEAVEPVSGACDLLVKVDVPIRAILVANKIRAKEWVKRFRILTVEHVEPEMATTPALSEVIAEEQKRSKIRDLLRIRAGNK